MVEKAVIVKPVKRIGKRISKEGKKTLMKLVDCLEKELGYEKMGRVKVFSGGGLDSNCTAGYLMDRFGTPGQLDLAPMLSYFWKPVPDWKNTSMKPELVTGVSEPEYLRRKVMEISNLLHSTEEGVIVLVPDPRVAEFYCGLLEGYSGQEYLPGKAVIYDLPSKKARIVPPVPV